LKIIDAHAHVIERLAGFGGKGELRPVGNGRARWATGEEIQVIPSEYGNTEFLAERLLDMMNIHGVEKAVLLQGSFYGFQNEYVHEVVQRYPDRFKGAATLDPFCADVPAMLHYLIDQLGYRILKFELSSGGGLMSFHPELRIDGAEMEPMWEKAQQYDIPVVLDIGRMGMKSFQIDAVKKVLGRHPSIRLVLPHLLSPTPGSSDGWLEALKELKHQNIWFDISALPWNMQTNEYPYPNVLAAAKTIIGADRLMWGSDVPILLTVSSYEKLLNFVMKSNIFTTTELEKVLGQTAIEVYNL
jgi:predicted TIM-barrel fold metal-dependent hydrolase